MLDKWRSNTQYNHTITLFMHKKERSTDIWYGVVTKDYT